MAVAAAAVVLLVVLVVVVGRQVGDDDRVGEPAASGSLPAGPGSSAPAGPAASSAPAPSVPPASGGSPTGATPSATAAADLPVSAALPPTSVVVSLKVDGERDLYVVDTTRLAKRVQLPTPDGDDGSPAMQPGRGTILYVNEGQLRVMAANGSGDRLLLDRQPKGCDEVGHVAWSWADPGLMVLQCEEDDRSSLVEVRLDGQVVRRLPVARKVVKDLSIAADGATLVYWASDDDDLDGGSIYSLRVDGSAKPVRLTKQPAGTDADPTWSPDGSQIAFRRRAADGSAEGNEDVWLMNFDGSGARPLVSTDATDRRPAWSPDGKELLVVSDRTTATGVAGATWDLWLVRLKDDRVLRSMGLGAQSVGDAYWSAR